MAKEIKIKPELPQEEYDPIKDGRRASAAENYRDHRDWQAFAGWLAKVLNSISVTAPVRVSVGLRVLDLHEQGQYVSEATIKEMAYTEQEFYTNLLI